jgi:hypothetical protein
MTAALWGFRGGDPAPPPDASGTGERPLPPSQAAPPIAPPVAEMPSMDPSREDAPPSASGSSAEVDSAPAPRAKERVRRAPPKPTPRRGRDPSATF